MNTKIVSVIENATSLESITQSKSTYECVQDVEDKLLEIWTELINPEKLKKLGRDLPELDTTVRLMDAGASSLHMFPFVNKFRNWRSLD